jgi:hypothetical protein
MYIRPCQLLTELGKDVTCEQILDLTGIFLKLIT